MFIFIILILLSHISTHCMEAPLGKRKVSFANAGTDSETEIEIESTKVARLPDSSSFLLFDLTPRITPLMIAVGNNDLGHVKFLLSEAKKRGCLNAYVNLDCGEYEKTALEIDAEFKFDCSKKDTALHLAADSDVSYLILFYLLQAGANPNAQNKEGYTALYRALPTVFQKKDKMTNSLKKVYHLHKYGVNPKIGHPNNTSYNRIEKYCKDKKLSKSMKLAYTGIKEWFDAKNS